MKIKILESQVKELLQQPPPSTTTNVESYPSKIIHHSSHTMMHSYSQSPSLLKSTSSSMSSLPSFHATRSPSSSRTCSNKKKGSSMIEAVQDMSTFSEWKAMTHVWSPKKTRESSLYWGNQPNALDNAISTDKFESAKSPKTPMERAMTAFSASSSRKKPAWKHSSQLPSVS